MAKSAVARVQSGPNGVKFISRYHELEFTDLGAGLCVLTPEWDDIALVLKRDDVERLKALCDVVLARP